jgi:hypothetical protein
MNEKDFNTLIVCAVRYALGRRTYIVSSITDIAKENIGIMQTNTKRAIINSILLTEDLGDSFDKKKWEELFMLLKNSLEQEINL